MNHKVFSSESACSQEIKNLLILKGISYELAESIGIQIARDCVDEPVSNTNQGFGLRIGSWLVKQEDLAFFDVLKTSTTLGVGAFMGDALTAPIVAAITAAAHLSWVAWRKGCRLTPLQVRIILELEVSEKGLTAREVYRRIGTKPPVTKGLVQESLNEMRNLISRSGNIEVVVVDGDDRWHTTH